MVYRSDDDAEERVALFSPLSVYISLERAIGLRSDRELGSAAKRSAVLAAAAVLLVGDGKTVSTTAFAAALQRVKRTGSNTQDENDIAAALEGRSSIAAKPREQSRGSIAAGAPPAPPRDANIAVSERDGAAGSPSRFGGSLFASLGARLRGRTGSGAAAATSPRTSAGRPALLRALSRESSLSSGEAALSLPLAEPKPALYAINELLHEASLRATTAAIAEGEHAHEREFDPFATVFPICATGASLKVARFARGEAHIRLSAAQASGESEERVLRLVTRSVATALKIVKKAARTGDRWRALLAAYGCEDEITDTSRAAAAASSADVVAAGAVPHDDQVVVGGNASDWF